MFRLKTKGIVGERVRAGVDGYSKVSNEDDAPTCEEQWREDYRYLMTPTRKIFEWNQTFWIDDYGNDVREEQCAYKVADVVFCKIPIYMGAILNCTVVATPGATLGCLFRPLIGGCLEPEKLTEKTPLSPIRTMVMN